jgi:hypothetical protein
VAAVSTSSLSLNPGLCSKDGAAIKHKLDTYPFDVPKANSIRKKRASELMMGSVEEGPDDAKRTLHARKRGTKSVCARERPRRRWDDQTMREGKKQRYRPKRSPRLKRRKWTTLKIRG